MFGHVAYNSSRFVLNLGDQFNTANVTNMSGMFTGSGNTATNFNLNLGNQFIMYKVTNTYLMFASIGWKSQSTFILNLAAGNFTNITNYANIFYNFPSNKATST